MVATTKNAKRRGAVRRNDGRRMQRLFCAYLSNEDARAKELIYRDNLRLAELIARRYAGRGVDYDDLYQEACLGLLTAIEKYDPSNGSKFQTYATYLIEGNIKIYFRDKTWPCSVPRDIKEMVRQTTGMRQRLGCEPNRDEISEAEGISLDKADEVIAAAHAYRPASLHQNDSATSINPIVDELFSCRDLGIDSAPGRLDLQASIAKALLPEEAWALVLRFCDELPQGEVAERMGIGRARTVRLINSATKKLAAALSEEGLGKAS